MEGLGKGPAGTGAGEKSSETKTEEAGPGEAKGTEDAGEGSSTRKEVFDGGDEGGPNHEDEVKIVEGMEGLTMKEGGSGE